MGPLYVHDVPWRLPPPDAGELLLGRTRKPFSIGFSDISNALQLLAVQHLHKRGIIHRDLKPENILFDCSGHLVIADFGVAHIFLDEEADSFLEDEYPLWAKMKRRGGDYFPLLTASIDNPHTVDGMAGTTYYSAPEVLEGQTYSYGVDYYSMAILYHEMVTGYVRYLLITYSRISSDVF